MGKMDPSEECPGLKPRNAEWMRRQRKARSPIGGGGGGRASSKQKKTEEKKIGKGPKGASKGFSEDEK